MRCCLILTVLLILALFIFASLVRADEPIYVHSTSPDGYTSLVSDGQQVYVTRNAIEMTINQAGIVAFTWMDNTSALMNRSDYGVLIVNVITNQVFWLGYNYPDDYCSPCNIGGGGTDNYPTSTPITPMPAPTKG